jgi:ribosomal-protein-alanine N-acetyltransferase
MESTSIGWTIDRVTSADELDGVVEVERQSFSSPWTREMFAWELEHSDVSRLYVIRTPTHPVAGFCSFWMIYDELHVNNLAIRPECRGRGLGSALLRHVLELGVERGVRQATLEVRRSNAGAQALYRRMGFREVGVRRAYYTHPVEDALILWWQAPPPTTTGRGGAA